MDVDTINEYDEAGAVLTTYLLPSNNRVDVAVRQKSSLHIVVRTSMLGSYNHGAFSLAASQESGPDSSINCNILASRIST